MRLRYFLVRASQDIAPLSLVRLYPLTGLKHQLRVHMAQALKGTLGVWWFEPLETVWIIPVTRSFAVPILGDALYGGAATTTSLHFSTYAGIPEGRLFLHSSSISFWVRAFF
jgi:23S rRNA-/tRNA-specific pseudouridylate synthase